MGTDIHLHIEVKINGKWHHYSHPSIARHYKLFAKMAGVREQDNIDPISLPKGFPPDATELSRFSYNMWKGDAHSDSWLSAQEIYELCEFMRSDQESYKLSWDESEVFGGYLFGNYFSGFAKHPEDMPEGLEDVRFVFWFDN